MPLAVGKSSIMSQQLEGVSLMGQASPPGRCGPALFGGQLQVNGQPPATPPVPLTVANTATACKEWVSEREVLLSFQLVSSRVSFDHFSGWFIITGSLQGLVSVESDTDSLPDSVP